MSYRRADGEDLACLLHGYFSNHSVDAFLDVFCLGAGKFLDNLKSFVAYSDVVIVLLTPKYIRRVVVEETAAEGDGDGDGNNCNEGNHNNSNKKKQKLSSDYCRLELQHALDQNKTILPVMKTCSKDTCFRLLHELADDDVVRLCLEQMNVFFLSTSTLFADMKKLNDAILLHTSELTGRPVNQRYFENTFLDFDSCSMIQIRAMEQRIHNRVHSEIIRMLRPLLDYTLNNLDDEDYSIYTGTAGNCLALWKTASYIREQGLAPEEAMLGQTCQQVAEQALEAAIRRANLAISNSHSVTPTPSFYMGPVGVHAIATMMKAKTDAEDAACHAKAVVDFLPVALRESETELLYGLPGYLYCLLIVKAHVPPALHPFGLDRTMKTVFNTIIKRGLEEASKISKQHDIIGPNFPGPVLAITWQGESYIGAAHGLAGVLYVLLHLPEMCLSHESKGAVKNSLDYLLSLQDGDGNWPAGLGEGRKSLVYWCGGGSGSLVHWCHGAPGIIPTLAKAYQVYGDKKYLQAAERAGDCVWKRGILRKGTGVCHGISGSALSLLTLYRATGQRRHLYRALRFIESTWHPEVLHVISQTEDPQRKFVGVPDDPKSLMEGEFGLLYAYTSVERPDRSSYPGYDGACHGD